MVAWIAGVSLIPLDAKLDLGDRPLALVLQAHAAQVYAGACWQSWVPC
jgi:hypothetical protein